MERLMMVVDIPADTTAEQAEEILNKPFEDGYYLTSIVGGYKSSSRAFFKRLKNREYQVLQTVGGNRANRDGKDEAAHAIITANTGLTVAALIHKLADAGITRKRTWVTNFRRDVKGSGVKHTS